MKLGRHTATALDAESQPTQINTQELIQMLDERSENTIKVENIMVRVELAYLHLALARERQENTRLWTALSIALAVILALLLWNGVG